MSDMMFNEFHAVQGDKGLEKFQFSGVDEKGNWNM